MGVIGMTLCSGIGAPEIAAPWIDWRLAAEIEAFPRAVLQHRFGYRTPTDHNQGDPLLWADMTEVTPDLMRQRGIPLPEIIVAGTPCQAFSVAGLRQGLEDPRGNLTLAFVEILHAIVAARPDGRLIAVWENVPGVLSDSGNAFGCFLGGLVGAVDALRPPGDGNWPGEGMVQGPRARAAWCILDAQWFGVAQRRRRVFVVVDFGGAVDPAAVLLEPDRMRGDSPPRREAGKGVAPTISARPTGGGGLGTDFDRDGGLIAFGGNNTAGPIEVSTALNSHGGPCGGMDFESETFVAHSLRGEGFDASEDGTGRGTPIVPVAYGLSTQQEPKWADDLSSTLARPSISGGGQVTAVAYAIQERAVSENLNAGPQGKGYQDELSYTLEARNKVQSVATDWAVRRLTPTECHRLQGFPDDHCDVPRGKRPGAPDGPQYKALGNSMAVPVMRWILDRVRIAATAHRKPQLQTLFDGAAE